MKEALDKLAEILNSDYAFEADCVQVDIANGNPVTEREKILAEVVHDCYNIVHPLTSECCKDLLSEAKKMLDKYGDAHGYGGVGYKTKCCMGGCANVNCKHCGTDKINELVDILNKLSTQN